MKKLHIFPFLILCFSPFFYADGQNNLSRGDHFANINGIKIHYYVSGKGPVCLVPSPGWGPSVSYLKNSLTPFENYFTIVYYDTRKSGLSTGPEDSTKYTSQDLLNDMDSLRVYLKQSKIWLMGHSMGGFHILNYGIHHSINLNGIIVFSPLAGRDSLKKAESARIIMKRKQDPYFGKGVRYLPGGDSVKNNLAEQMQVTLPFYFHDTSKVKDLINIGFLQLSDTAFKYTRSSHLSREYLFPDLNKINVPCLIIVGDDDPICDKISQSDRVAANIPGSSEVVIKDTGHFTWLEQPDQVYAACFAWLKKQNLKEYK